jgi:CheY-like chemotaxis protein
MGGVVWVEDNVPKGSVFKFKLPYRPVKDTPLSSSFLKQDNKKIVFDLVEKTILLVDDVETNLLLLQAYLVDTGATLLLSSNQKDAIDIALSEKVDLVLMDCKLYDDPKAGIDASIQILKHKPSMPIIMQTAYVDGVKEDALNAGCVGCLTKPISKEKLFELIRKVL